MILYEDKDIIVCHKMAGIAVQSARIGEKDLVSMLNNHLMEQADQRMEPVRVVHRLDQPVEGIVVFAKNKKAAASLSAQITDGSMKKVYQAVCCVTEAGGHWIGNAGKNDQELIDYMAKDARTNSSADRRMQRRRGFRFGLWPQTVYRTSSSRSILLPGAIIRSGCRWRMPDFRSLVIENIIRIGNCMQRRGRRRW